MVECSYIAELAGKQIGTIATAADLRRRAGQALRNRGVTPVKWPPANITFQHIPCH